MVRALVAMMAFLLVLGFSGGPAGAQGAANCTSFASQAEAEGAFAANPGDAAGLDEDGDGIACEDVIYANPATDLAPVLRIGGAGITESQGSGTRGIGASGSVDVAPQASEATEGGIGASGITSPRGVGAAGTNGGQRDALAGTMTSMPNTGTGPNGPGRWVTPLSLLVMALAAGWLSARSIEHNGA